MTHLESKYNQLYKILRLELQEIENPDIEEFRKAFNEWKKEDEEP